VALRPIGIGCDVGVFGVIMPVEVVDAVATVVAGGAGGGAWAGELDV
jgi:hypothetical protein